MTPRRPKDVLSPVRGDFGVARNYAQVVQKKKRSGAAIRAAGSGPASPNIDVSVRVVCHPNGAPGHRVE